MPKIHLLNPEEINKIAAGEVVERPVSIVKELFENAIDAGSTRIDVYVNDGGKSLVRIVDNGCGMSPDDAQMACVQHATSKINTIDDLTSIASYGFRGEALASIASVSTFQLITKERESQTGIKLVLHNGAVQTSETVACPQGTDIAITNLFDNVPARKKFLKATETEFNQIQALVQAYACAHECIHLRLFHNDRLVHNCPPVDALKSRIAQVWDEQCVHHLLDVAHENAGIKLTISGFITNHTYGRYNTGRILLFVNKRWIKNAALTRAIVRGYANVYQPGKYPAAVLFIETDPALIDVNIHPRKEEVQFVHSGSIERAAQNIVKERLEAVVRQQLQNSTQATVNSISYTARQEVGFFKTPSYFTQELPEPYAQKTSTETKNFAQGSLTQEITGSNLLRNVMSSNKPTIKFPEATSGETEVSGEGVSPTKSNEAARQRLTEMGSERNTQDIPHIIGQHDNTYILIAHPEGIVFVDQHAAHERIIYEQLTQSAQNTTSITLLFPHTVTITPSEVLLLEKNQDTLKTYGIITEMIGPERLAISASPIVLKSSNLTEVIKKILADLEQNNESADPHHTIRARMACAGATKAGDQLTIEKMREIITQLRICVNNTTCPHGRPTTWLLPTKELEKKFKRNYPISSHSLIV